MKRGGSERYLQPVDLVPSAKRLIRSLRDLGYDFNQAVADLIDNSIEASATRIEINVEFDGDNSRVEIIDDGRGMPPNQLAESMRYGSERDYGEHDLGKFGLGMKTASMSQCQRLVVASRHKGPGRQLAAYTWDLAHIERTNRWEVLPIEINELSDNVQAALLERTSGTAVIWEQLDRILGYKHPYGEYARKQLSSMCRDLEKHLSMVFHNFLDAEDPAKSITIRVNGNDVKPWDPFCRAEERTQTFDPIVISVRHEGRTGEMVMLPFILPNRESFSSYERWEDAAGIQGWNQQQGFYIYRAGRMIQAGSWSKLFAVDEHMKLARIAILFDPILDDAFKVNVAKMRAQLPASVRKEVREKMSAIRKEARRIYDKGSLSPSVSVDKAINSNTRAQQKDGDIGRSVEPTHVGISSASSVSSQFAYFEQLLLEECRPSERPIVKRVLDRVRRSRIGGRHE